MSWVEGSWVKWIAGLILAVVVSREYELQRQRRSSAPARK
jgi:hypothetical protein